MRDDFIIIGVGVLGISGVVIAGAMLLIWLFPPKGPPPENIQWCRDRGYQMRGLGMCTDADGRVYLRPNQ